MDRNDTMKTQLSLTEYIIVFAGLLASGLGSFIRRKKDGYSLRKVIIFLIIDIVGSVSVGLPAFLLVYGYSDNIILSAGVGSILGHLGPRGIYLMELAIAEKIGSETLKEEILRYHNQESKK